MTYPIQIPYEVQGIEYVVHGTFPDGEVQAIQTWDGSLIPAAQYDRLGITADVLDDIQDRLACFELPDPCRCGERCVC